MSERRGHLLMQRGSETLRRSTGSLFACIVKHAMRSARSCAAVMAVGSWKQPDERCYIEQPWAPSLGTKMAPGERAGQSCEKPGSGKRLSLRIKKSSKARIRMQKKAILKKTITKGLPVCVTGAGGSPRLSRVDGELIAISYLTKMAWRGSLRCIHRLSGWVLQRPS